MDGEDWEHLVRDCGGHPLHLPEVHAADQSGECVHLLFHDGTEPVGCGIGFLSDRGRWRRKPRRFVLPASVAVRRNSGGDRTSIYERIVAFAREQKCSELVIQPHWGSRLEDLSLFSGHVDDVLVEFVLDLNREQSAIEAGMHRVHRKNVRRAARDGVTAEPDRTLDGLLTLRDMQQVSSDRSAKKGGGFTVRDRTFFERLHKNVYEPGRGELLLARHEGKTVAGLAYVIGAGRGITVRSGSTPDGYALQAMYLLQSTVIERARERGVLELNLGGVPESATASEHSQHGLYEFKRGWGGTEIRSTGIRIAIPA